MQNQASILVVDDDEVVRETLEMLLDSEYKLYFAENGLDGLALALQKQPDVLLLDIMMPGVNGFETCRQIRSSPLIAEMPIIMITALEDRDSRLEGLRSGADDFISKPFDGIELSARIQTITRLNRYRRLIEQRNELEITHQKLLASYTKTIEGWVNALDLRDKETEGHSIRVTKHTVEFARVMGIAEDKIETIRLGALLHDVGKLGIPDSILLKPGALDPEEWEIMRKHPEYAYHWLSSIEYLLPSLDIPYCHHEKWDGSGYPRKLRGEEIPLEARMFAIVDVWDALCSSRPYRSALPVTEVLAYIQQQSDQHFDPALVEVFLTIRHTT